MKVELVWITPDSEKIIEQSARECHQSLDKMGTDPKFISRIMKMGHYSVLEHVSAGFRISEVSRALTHQLVRHRIAAYSQVSQRYVPHQESQFVVPRSVINKYGLRVYQKCLQVITKKYRFLVEECKVPKEDARFLLPNATHTTIRMTCNFRSWFEILQKRLHRGAQWEIRDMFVDVYSILHENAPSVFNKKNLLHIPVIRLDERIYE